MPSIDYSDDTPDVAFTYDRLGRVLSATNSAAAYYYAYDAFGRLTNEVGSYATLVRHYDTLGRSIGYDLLDGYTGTLSRVRYEYAADGRFAAVVWTNRGESTCYRADYSYLAGSGLLAALTNSSGMAWTRSYEAHRDLLTTVENRNGTNLLSRYDYANDALGRRTARQDGGPGATATVENSFDYNERSELTSALMGTNVYAYDFDPIGNRREASRLEAAAAVTNLYTANALNQYSYILCASAPPRETLPTYDVDGNMTNNGSWSYAWDAENRLIETRQNGQLTGRFAYDHQSRRIKTFEFNDTNWPFCHTYDGWNLVRRERHERLETYAWGIDLSGSLQGAGGIGGLLSMAIYLWADGEPYPDGYPWFANVVGQYAFDGNGNVTDLLGTFYGQASSCHYDYDPFGRLIGNPIANIHTYNPFRFSTKYADPYTPGLLYYGYRWYDPELGRWLSRDPIGEEGGEDLYAFVLNDPIDRIDWLGLIAVFKYLDFIYRNTAGEIQKLTSATKAEDVQLEYDHPEDGGQAKLRYHSGRYSDFSKYGQRDVCRVSIRLQIHVSMKYQNKGDAYREPTAATFVYYRKHWDTGPHDMVFRVLPDSDDISGLIIKEHERGHARGMIELVFKHGLGTKIEQALDWTKLMPLVIAGNDAEAGQLVDQAIIDAMIQDDVFRVHMQAADKATLGIFQGRANWMESTSEAPYHIKWSFTP